MPRGAYRKTHRLGAYSQGKALINVDRRTREGKFATAVESELLAHLGGAPTAPQRLIVQLASMKALRIALLTDVVLSADAINERDDRQLVAWMNSLRLDLVTLGIERQAEHSPRLKDVLLGSKAA